MNEATTELSPLEQVTNFLEGLKNEINELKALRDASTIQSFKDDYQKKVTEKVDEYNSIVQSI